MGKSEQAYQKVVELNPREAPQVFYNLGALIMNKDDRGDDDTQRAIAAFRKAVELKPDYREAHKQLAFALLGAGDPEGAKAELEACLRLAPDAPDAKQVKALIDSLQ
jgi:tetratricopeptide (TPR) repeat protein